jgi:hypothetical protein
MTSVNNIKNAIAGKGGVAQSCHYVLTIVPPLIFNAATIQNSINKFASGNILDGLTGVVRNGLQQLVLSQSKHISMLAESCSIPGRQLLTTEHRIFGTVRKMPYGVLYEDFTVTFICTNSMIERLFFDTWQQLIMSAGSQYMEFYDNYVGSIVIQKISNHTSAVDLGGTTNVGKICSVWKLLEAYPVSIQAQELSYADGDYLRLTVQFSYAKWQTLADRILSNQPNLPWIGEDSMAGTGPTGVDTQPNTNPNNPVNTPTTPGNNQTQNPGAGAGGVTPRNDNVGVTPTPTVPPTANPSPTTPPDETPGPSIIPV